MRLFNDRLKMSVGRGIKNKNNVLFIVVLKKKRWWPICKSEKGQMVRLADRKIIARIFKMMMNVATVAQPKYKYGLWYSAALSS